MTTHLSLTGSPSASSDRKLCATPSDFAVRGVVREESIVESGSRLAGEDKVGWDGTPEVLESTSSPACEFGLVSGEGATGDGADEPIHVEASH